VGKSNKQNVTCKILELIKNDVKKYTSLKR
jgi:hypothetical protein